MTEIMIHKIGFFKLNSKNHAVHAVSFDPVVNRLAVARATGTVDVFHCNKTFSLEKVYAACEFQSVEAIAWCCRRLFSVGLNGYIVQYGESTCLSDIESLLVSPSPIWSMSVNHNLHKLAVGTEDGGIFLLKITDKFVEVERSFAKTDSRIMCLCWNQFSDPDMIVSGNVDSVSIWSVKKARCSQQLSMPREQRSSETLVWCIDILSNNVMATGDSTGRVSFWNLDKGLLISSYLCHSADILSFAFDKLTNCLYAGGIDPTVTMFKPVSSDSSDQKRKRVDSGSGLDLKPTTAIRWVESIRINVHSHDVRSMCMAGKWLVSGGVDTFIGLHTFPPKQILKIAPFRTMKYSVARVAQCLMVQHASELELWRLGSCSKQPNDAKDGDQLPLTTEPENLLQLKSKCQRLIRASAVSVDAQYVLYSDDREFRSYRLEKDGVQLSVMPATCLDFTPVSLQWVQFLQSTSNSDFLGSADSLDESFLPTHFALGLGIDGTWLKLQFDKYVCRKVPQTSKLKENVNSVCMPVFNPCESVIAVALNDWNVIVLGIKKMTKICQLPKMTGCPQSMCFSSDSTLIVLYSDNQLVEFDIKTEKFSKFCQHVFMNDKFREQTWLQLPAYKVIFVDDLILLHNSQDLLVLDRRKCVDGRFNGEIIRGTNRYEHIMFLDAILSEKNARSLIVAHCSANKYLSELSDALKKKKFGTG